MDTIWSVMETQFTEASTSADDVSSSSSNSDDFTPPRLTSPSSTKNNDDEIGDERDDDDDEDEDEEEEEEEGEAAAPRRKYKKRWANSLPPCRVCAEPSSGFHYGVNTCEACKMFFKRCQTRKRPLRCKGKRNCQVQGVKRVVCGYCRYHWCLTLGMSRGSIKLGRYTCTKRRQDCQEITRSTTTLTPLSVTDHHLQQLTDQLMTSHAIVLTTMDVPEEELVEKAKARFETIQLEEELFGRYKEISFEEYQQIYRQTGLDIDDRSRMLRVYAKCMEKQIRSFVHFAKGVPGFSGLPLDDQVSLIKASHAELWFLGVYRGFIHKYQTYVSPVGFSLHMKEYAPCMGLDIPLLRHDVAVTLKRRLQFLSKREIVLLKAICLMSPDRCQLKDKDRVEEIHWGLVCALLTSLRKTRGRTDPVTSRGSSDLELDHDEGRVQAVRDILTENLGLGEMDFRVNLQSANDDVTNNDVSDHKGTKKPKSFDRELTENPRFPNDTFCRNIGVKHTHDDSGVSSTGQLPQTEGRDTCMDGAIAASDRDVSLSDVTLFSYVIDCMMALRTLTEKEKKAHENTPLVVDIFQSHPMLIEVMMG